MSTMSVKNLPPELPFELAGNCITSYVLNRIYPSPDLRFFLVITSVDTVVRKSIFFFSKKIARHLTKKNGYLNENGHPTNFKFFHLLDSGAVILANLSPFFYKFVTQKMGLQTPTYIMTLTYIVLTARVDHILIHAFKFLICSLHKPEERRA